MSSDLDYEIALKLQLEYDTEISLDNEEGDDIHDKSTIEDFEKTLPNGYQLPQMSPAKPKQPAVSRSIQGSSSTKKMSILDPSWEMMDPSPDIHALFLQYNTAFFFGKLDSAEVRWSPRMTLCAGLCVYQRRGGFCSIRLSAPLLKLRPRKDLVETLLHEMIHAFLFLTNNNKDHDDHGPEFKKHMSRINGQEGTAISVYHSFHDEVDAYRQHWWRCAGPCRQRKPFYGWVKRSMNRVPSARDLWWAQHQATCGGTYTKVKEPEGYGQKKKGGTRKKQNETEPILTTGKTNKKTENTKTKDIRSLFGDKTTNKTSDKKTTKTDNDTNNRNPTNNKNPFSEQSAKIIDNIGKGKTEKIQSATNFPNLPEKSTVGEGVGRSSNIHSVGEFLNGESTKDSNNSARNSVPAFLGSGKTLGGGTKGQQPRSGCKNSRLLSNFDTGSMPTGALNIGASNRSARGEKRLSSEGQGQGEIGKRSKTGSSSAAGSAADLNNYNTKTIANGTVLETRDSDKCNSDNGNRVDFGIKKQLNSPPESSKSESPADLRSYFSNQPRNSSDRTGTDITTTSSTPEAINTEITEVVSCPVCNSKVSLVKINEHLNSCLN